MTLGNNYCCYCCDLKSGTQTIGIISLVWCFLCLFSGFITGTCLIITGTKEFEPNCEIYQECYTTNQYYAFMKYYGVMTLVIPTCYYGYQIYLGFLLLKGIKTDNHRLLEPWISVTSIIFFMHCASTLFFIIITSMSGYGMLLTFLFFVIPCLTLMSYFIYIVQSYKDLLIKREMIQSGVHVSQPTTVTVTSIVPPSNVPVSSQGRGFFNPPAYDVLPTYHGTEMAPASKIGGGNRSTIGTVDSLVASDELSIQQQRLDRQAADRQKNVLGSGNTFFH